MKATIKLSSIIAISLLINPCFAQENKVAYGVSAFKRVNTLSYFNNSSSGNSLAYTSSVPTLKEGESIIYFDRNYKQTSADKAYYYRKAQFDQSQAPVGIVEDYYKGTNKLKFIGKFLRYDTQNEAENRAYQGDCIFYAEDGTKSVRTYNNGELEKDFSYYADGKIKSEQLYNTNKTRKYFKEVVYDKNGLEKEVIVGKYNAALKIETATKYIYDDKGKQQMLIDYEDNCPMANVTYFGENNTEYRAVLQNFTCVANPKEWSWQGAEGFKASFLEKENKYQILTNTDKVEGALTVPVTGDFKGRPFEVVAEFDKPKQTDIKEFGIVWQYQDKDNYSYFIINTEENTFSINAKAKGEAMKFMTGIKPQLTDIPQSGKYMLKIAVDPTQNKFIYSVNGQAISGYNKFPFNHLIDMKKINAGFVFKSLKANESIVLTKFEFKLL
ncbi:hypothetical protein [Emticicia sp. 17c]|uniref:hypothetical protein n=1 Tax=Emticicia sp. 17c TaxID=3127704 RepID=UPI00301C57B8